MTTSAPIRRRPAVKPVLAKIARDIGVDTLEERHSDRLDFHDISAMSLRRALEAAYAAGKAAR